MRNEARGTLVYEDVNSIGHSFESKDFPCDYDLTCSCVSLAQSVDIERPCRSLRNPSLESVVTQIRRRGQGNQSDWAIFLENEEDEIGDGHLETKNLAYDREFHCSSRLAFLDINDDARPHEIRRSKADLKPGDLLFQGLRKGHRTCSAYFAVQ